MFKVGDLITIKSFEEIQACSTENYMGFRESTEGFSVFFAPLMSDICNYTFRIDEINERGNACIHGWEIAPWMVKYMATKSTIKRKRKLRVGNNVEHKQNGVCTVLNLIGKKVLLLTNSGITFLSERNEIKFI